MANKGITKTIKREKLAVTYKGVFDLKNFYEFLHDWVEANGFGSASGGGTWESFYWERRSTAGMTDYNIWWRLKKNPDEQNSSWVEYKLNIDFLGLAIAKTDTMHNGKKVGAYKGEWNVFITPWIEIDQKKLWNSNSILGKFSEVFMKRTFKKDLKYHKDQLDDVAFRLEEAVKDFFGLSTFGEYGETFHPRKGLGWG